MRVIGKVLGLLLPLCILGAAGGTVSYLYNSAPSVGRTAEQRQLPMVLAVPVERRNLDRVVEAYGTVGPAREVKIYPEVSGRVVRMHPALEPGGVIPGGEVLVEIDPEAYQLVLDRAMGNLAEAEAALEVEQGRQLIAKREWELYGQGMQNAELGQSLALREPQLRQAQARITTARSVVREAELDLRRTRIEAPFDVLVLAENVDVGQYVSPGTLIASMAGSESFWVNASVPAARLEAILEAFRDGTSLARVFSQVDGSQLEPIPGRLVRYLGRVDPEGRMAQLLVEVADPLGLDPLSPPHPVLSLNTYVRVELEAGHIAGAVVLPRRAYRENGEVWVVDAENRLQIRTVPILWRQEELLAVEDLFFQGDRIVMSPVGDLLPRMEVRLAEEGEDTDSEVNAVPSEDSAQEYETQ